MYLCLYNHYNLNGMPIYSIIILFYSFASGFNSNKSYCDIRIKLLAMSNVIKII